MEHINWTFQIISWIITICITPLIASLFAKNQMKKQLEKTYTNERKSKINDLQIENLSELHDTLSKSVTVINHIRSAHFNYFMSILNEHTEATDKTWEEHNLSIQENEKTKVNYQPQIRKKLLLVPNFKKDFTNTHVEIDNQNINYIEFDNYIKYNKPKELFEKAKYGKLTTQDVDIYIAYSGRYFSLLQILYNKLEDKIERIIEEETKFQH